jgi:CBS domain-containing protein
VNRVNLESTMPMTVRDVMTHRVVAVTEQPGFREVLGLLATHHVSALPVVDGHRRVVGVISEGDLYLKQVRPPHGLAALLEDRRRRQDQRKAVGAIVAELMSAPAITIRADQSLAEAATRMHRHGVNRLPVVDEAGVLVGIVTRGDLLKAYVRVDQDVRRDILTRAVPEVIERVVESVQVEVHDGVVELSGWLTRRSQVLALIARARATDGVVTVHSKVRYDVNDTSDGDSRDPAA